MANGKHLSVLILWSSFLCAEDEVESSKDGKANHLMSHPEMASRSKSNVLTTSIIWSTKSKLKLSVICQSRTSSSTLEVSNIISFLTSFTESRFCDTEHTLSPCLPECPCGPSIPGTPWKK